jgi:hypothetical protein
MAKKLLLGIVNGCCSGEASEAVPSFPAREDLPFGGREGSRKAVTER